MDVTLRTKKTQKKYEDYLKTPESKNCCFCREINNKKCSGKSEIFIEWDNWCLMKNAYPYDKAYEKHDLLFCKRHVDYDQLTVQEEREFKYILGKLKGGYHQMVENIGERQSQKSHYHLHLCRFL